MFMDAYRADDRFKYQDSKSDFYAEFSPRLDLSKITGTDLSFLFVKKIYLAFQYNLGEEYKAYLYGLGSSLDIPGFNVFDLNIYKKNQNIGENNYQFSINYTTKKIYNIFHINSFIDWTELDFLTEQQFLFDVAKPFKTHNLYIGGEWHYYRQKAININFNTKITSNVFQAMIKYSW